MSVKISLSVKLTRMERILIYKLIAFDLDGTVGETFPVIFDAFRKTVYKYTHREISDNEILSTFGANEIGMLNQLIPHAPANILDDFYQQYQESHAALTAPFPGIKNLLDHLKNRQIVTPLVTGKGSVSCRISLEKLGLVNYFSPILIGSSKGPNKAENFKKLLDRYHLVPSQMAYVADTIGDIDACRSVGIDCYSAAWSQYADSNRLRQVNQFVFESVADLSAALDNRINH